jgi:hypothetical protein
VALNTATHVPSSVPLTVSPFEWWGKHMEFCIQSLHRSEMRRRNHVASPTPLGHGCLTYVIWFHMSSDIHIDCKCPMTNVDDDKF